MRSIGSFLLCIVGILMAGCSDLPTVPIAAPPTDIESASYDQAAGCVTDGFCLLPPITVTPGDCDPWMSLDWCSGGGDSCMETVPGDPDAVGVENCPPGSGGPGDSGPGAPPPGGGDDPTCSEWDPYCEQPPTEDRTNDEGIDCIDLGCELRDATAAERQKVLDAISTLREDGFCGEVRANALAMVNRRLQVWDNRVYAPNDQGQLALLLGEAPWSFELQAPIMYLWSGAINAWTIAHEAIHGIWNPDTPLGNYYTHSNITPLGMNLDDTAKYCSRN